MKLSHFIYEYPRELIAKYPAEPRDHSRLMVLDRKTQSIEHRDFHEIVEYFHEGDVLVVNDTKVFPARLYGNKDKTGARIAVFLLRELNPESRLWDVIVDPARKIRIGNKLYFENGLIAEVIDNTTSRGRTIRFAFEGSNQELYTKIDEIGQTPLPHMRWNDVRPAATDSLFRGIEAPRYYFLHSFRFVPRQPADVLATARYGSDFTAAVRSGHVFGTQFHPEKSHQWGIELLRNFAKF